MTKYFTQFDESTQTIGTNLAGWTVRGGGAPGRAPAYDPASSVPVNRRYLPLTNASTADFDDILSWDTIDADANRATVNLVTCLITPLADCQYAAVYVRGVGTGTVTDYVRCRLNLAGNSLHFDKMVAGVATADVGSVAYTLSASKSYFVRIVGNGTAFTVKVWDAALGMAGEPTAQSLSATVTGVTAAGWVGLACYHGASTGKIAPFNFLAVATNGDTADCPRTNAEFYDWANKPNQRCIIAEMQATGYNSAASPYTKTVNAYVSNLGYTSKQQDTPSLKHYDNYIAAVPTFSRNMGEALAGASQVGFGELVLKNPAKAIAGEAYLLLDGSSGCYASTPDSAANSITGDLDLRADVALDDWTPTGDAAIVGKHTSTGNQRSYILRVTSGGLLQLYRNPDGTAPSAVFVNSTVSTGFADGSRHWVRATLDVNDGAGNNVVKFYTSADGVTWTQLGATVTTAGVTSLFDSTSIVQIGAYDTTGSLWAGKVYRAQIYNGIAGTLVVDFNLGNVRKGATSVATVTGEVWTLAGTAAIRQSDDTAPGRLDDWIRARWNRNYFRMFVGSIDWPRHDFRPIVTGRLGIPSAPSPDLIRFPIADLSDFFNVELSRNRFASGDFINRAKQKSYGLARCVELQVDSSTKIATITDGFTNDMNDATYRIFDATSDGFTHIGGTKSATLAISSVDAATDTITANAAHNLQAGYRVRFSVGSVPTGLAVNTNYWVLAAGLTSTAFKVTATKGSTTPVDLTSGAGTANITSYGYTFSTSGTVEFVNLPVGRAFCFVVSAVAGGSATATIRDIAFNDAGLSLNFKDAAAFTAALAIDTSAGDLHAPIDKGYTCRDALDIVAQRCRVWYGFSTDGLLQAGVIGLPGATAVRSFTSSDVKLAGVSLTKIDRPIDFTRSRIYTGPWYTIGPQPQISGVDLNATNDPGTNSAELFSGHAATGAYTGYGAAGIPLDDHPDQTDSNTTTNFDPYSGDVATLVSFYKWPMGFFEIKTKFGALWTTSRPLALGDTISLEYPRLGWKNYTGSDDLSPDNTGDYDARLAVVRGIAVNLAAPPDEQVVLQVYRPIRGYYPAADFN